MDECQNSNEGCDQNCIDIVGSSNVCMYTMSQYSVNDCQKFINKDGVRKG